MSEPVAIGIVLQCSTCKAEYSVLHNQTNMNLCPKCGGGCFTVVDTIYRGGARPTGDRE